MLLTGSQVGRSGVGLVARASELASENCCGLGGVGLQNKSAPRPLHVPRPLHAPHCTRLPQLLKSIDAVRWLGFRESHGNMFFRANGMPHQFGPFIVRQHAFAFIAFCVSGLLACVLPWVVGPLPIGMRLGCLGFGLLALFAGILGWKAARIGLVADRRGIWLAGYSFIRKRLIPWDSIIAVKKVTWNSPEGEHTDVVIGLASIESHPARELLQLHNAHFAAESDDERFRIPLRVGHDEWDWEPEAFVELVQQCINAPDYREALGVFPEH